MRERQREDKVGKKQRIKVKVREAIPVPCRMPYAVYRMPSSFCGSYHYHYHYHF